MDSADNLCSLMPLAPQFHFVPFRVWTKQRDLAEPVVALGGSIRVHEVQRFELPETGLIPSHALAGKYWSASVVPSGFFSGVETTDDELEEWLMEDESKDEGGDDAISTEQIASLVQQGFSVLVSDGPFKSPADAQYAFDVRYEAMED